MIDELTKFVNEAIRSKMIDINVCLPAFISSYDPETQTASVQPAIKRVYKDGDEKNLPIINKVPVIFPKSKDKFIHFPLKKGDQVTLIFSQRSLDTWKESQEVVKADDPRCFHLSDAFCLPGGYSKITHKPKSDGIEVVNGENYFSIENDGTIKMINESGEFILNADGSASISGDLTVGGKVSATGNVETQADVKTASITSLNGHTHPFTNADGAPSVTGTPSP